MYCVSPSVRIPVTGSRVAWALGLTMARCWPTSALRRVDFPTLGAPARAMWPVRVGIAESRSGSRVGPRESPTKASLVGLSLSMIVSLLLDDDIDPPVLLPVGPRVVGRDRFGPAVSLGGRNPLRRNSLFHQEVPNRLGPRLGELLVVCIRSGGVGVTLYFELVLTGKSEQHPAQLAQLFPCHWLQGGLVGFEVDSGQGCDESPRSFASLHDGRDGCVEPRLQLGGCTLRLRPKLGFPLRLRPSLGRGLGRAVERRLLSGCLPLPLFLHLLLRSASLLPSFRGPGHSKLARDIGPAGSLPRQLRVLLLILRFLDPGRLQ